MSSIKVSALTAKTTPSGSEELLINDGGTSKKITIDNVTENNFTDTLKSKLDAIEASADVTDTTNVTSAGALMDSEVTNLAAVKAFATSDYATSTQGTTADAALPKAGGTMTGAVSLGDNVKAKFGASDDLQIYHDGSNSYITDAGTGTLIINGSTSTQIKGSSFVILRSSTGENMAVGNANGSFDLYYDNSQKLATTSTGVDVTGSVTCDGFTSTGIDDNATSTAITIDSGENVGIGTSVLTTNTTIKELHVSSPATNGVALLKLSAPVENMEAKITLNGYLGADKLMFGLGNTGLDSSITRMSIGTTGDVTVETGNLVIGTSGKGIDFSANGNAAGMTSEVLDDYEEGTWTPAVSGGGTLSFTVNNATYTKIGDMVTVWCHIGGGGNGDGTTLVFSGLPFTSINANGNDYHVGSPIDFNNTNATMYNPHARVGPGSSLIYFLENGSTNINQGQLDVGHVIFTITYKAA